MMDGCAANCSGAHSALSQDLTLRGVGLRGGGRTGGALSSAISSSTDGLTAGASARTGNTLAIGPSSAIHASVRPCRARILSATAKARWCTSSCNACLRSMSSCRRAAASSKTEDCSDWTFSSSNTVFACWACSSCFSTFPSLPPLFSSSAIAFAFDNRETSFTSLSSSCSLPVFCAIRLRCASFWRVTACSALCASWSCCWSFQPALATAAGATSTNGSLLLPCTRAFSSSFDSSIALASF
mmetsp:Transcript_49901/g.93530  ORF Transcript_49901/g.93530 Transcript_49901/m.93530 type:complete len:242 (+) Transcript_49901:401-1126(+)